MHVKQYLQCEILLFISMSYPLKKKTRGLYFPLNNLLSFNHSVISEIRTLLSNEIV